MLEVKKDPLSISVIENQSQEDEKASRRKNPASSSKTIDKYSFDFEGLAKSLNQLTNEVSELKRITSDASGGEKPAKPFSWKTNNLPPHMSQTSNSNFNDAPSAMLTLEVICGWELLTSQEAIAEDTPPKTPKSYNLRIKHLVFEATLEDKKRAFLQRILPHTNISRSSTSAIRGMNDLCSNESRASTK